METSHSAENGIKIDWKFFLVISAGAWCAEGIYSTLNTGLFQQLSNQPMRWLATIIYNFSTAFVWWIFTSVILWIVIWIGQNVCGWVKTLSAHFLMAFTVACIQRLVNVCITYTLIKSTEAVDPTLLKWENFMGISFYRNVGNGIIVYIVVAGILYGYIQYLKNIKIKQQQSELEVELANVKMENLKYQLQPHFIFNSLQSVSTLMHRNTNLADDALNKLGELLRHSISNIERDETTIGDELLYLQKYIDLQTTRFGDNFSASIDFDHEIIDFIIPSFLLQPLVENSIKHGVEKTGKSTTVQIRIMKTDSEIVIDCEDNNISADYVELTEGVGLRNIKQRLVARYNGLATISYGFNDQLGYKVSLSLPIDNF